MEEILSDKRFAHIAKDPKFRRIPRAVRKVKIDKRFQSMFKDKKFAIKYAIDKRGRPVNQTTTENLRKYYEMSSSSEDESDEDHETKKKVQKEKKDKEINKGNKVKQKEKKDFTNEELDNDLSNNVEEEEEDQYSEDENNFSSNGDLLRIKPKKECDVDSESKSDSSESEAEKSDLQENKRQLQIRRKNEKNKLTDVVKERLKDLSINYARGEGFLLTDSSSDEESSEYSDEDEEIEHNWGELDKEAETTDEITHRLAVCNMDWDRMRAVDLMVLFNSFLPSGGLIRSVTIYPSEFGKQRMKEEEINGPTELVEKKDDDDDDNQDDNEEGSDYHMEKLRQYQLNRLKYYYAVIDFDSAETANKVYTECDGIEYESTATKLDLRFIPDDMAFDETPKEICEKLPEISKYQPKQFTTTALQQVKVELTWDETNPERQEITQKLSTGKFDEINENDIQAYLASGTSDDESDQEKSEKDESNQDEEIKKDPIEKYKSLLKLIEEQAEAKKNKEVELEFTWGIGTKEKSEKLVKERMKQNEDLTPFEQYLEKRKAKKKAKKEERKKLKQQEENNDTDSEDSVPSEIDLNDPYFKEEMKNTKPAHPKQKKPTKKDGAESAEENGDEDQQKAELELLLMDKTDEENKRHFNMKEIEENSTLSKSKRKRLKKKNTAENQAKEDDFEVNVKDPRFNALFTSHHFNIDPADPHYRQTKGTEALISEKLKRRANDDMANDTQAKQPKTSKKLNVELQALIKSVKKNAQNISQPIK